MYKIQQSPSRLSYIPRPTEITGCTESSRYLAPFWAYISMVIFNICYSLCVKLPPLPQAHVFDTQYPVDGIVRESCEIFSGWTCAGGSRLLGWSLMFYNWHLLPVHPLFSLYNEQVSLLSLSCLLHHDELYDSGTMSPKLILCPSSCSVGALYPALRN